MKKIIDKLSKEEQNILKMWMNIQSLSIAVDACLIK